MSRSIPTQVPSYTAFTPSSETASRVKRANRKRDTAVELLLRRRLWRMGLRYRVNRTDLPGKPDIVFSGARVAVFCDGDFWHGRDWEQRQRKLSNGSNAAYWTAKIARNRERDAEVTARLQADGWRVVRLWETDIKRDTEAAAELIRALVTQEQP